MVLSSTETTGLCQTNSSPHLHEHVPDVCHEGVQVLFKVILVDLHEQVDVGTHCRAQQGHKDRQLQLELCTAIAKQR